MTSVSSETAGRSPALDVISSLRPGQWTKNLIVFAALLFGRELFDPQSLGRALLAFVAFCAFSGAGYLVNDVVDRDADRRHPLKADRPIAAGRLPVSVAVMTAAALALGGLGLAVGLGRGFALVAAAYLGLQALYSVALKRIVIIDVLAIAVGFVLRAVGGGAVIGVAISQWLLICTILLALFLALSKRRHELTLLSGEAGFHRPILKEYSPYLLDQMIAVVTASTLIGYAFYTVSPDTVAKFGTERLALTVPFPLYGIFRYLYLVHLKSEGGSPSELLLNDRPLLVCVALWVLSVIAIIYEPWRG